MDKVLILRNVTLNRAFDKFQITADAFDTMYFDTDGKLKYIPEMGEMEIAEKDAAIYEQIEEIYQDVKKDFENGVKFTPEEYEEI